MTQFPFPQLGLPSLRLPGLYGQQPTSDQVELTPEEEQSLLGNVGGGLMSGLQWVGETLDKPGAAVRGLLSGDVSALANLIPFADTIAGMVGAPRPNRVSGRDMLEKWGWVGPNEDGLDAADIGGFAAEMITDPLSWINPFSAFTKAGKAAKAAGLMDKATEAARAAKMGKRAFRASNKSAINELLGGLDDAAKAEKIDTLKTFAKKSLGIDADLNPNQFDELLNSPLQKHLGASIPLIDPTNRWAFNIPGGDKYLKAQDWLGKLVTGNKYYRGAAALADSDMRGVPEESAQAHLPALARAKRENAVLGERALQDMARPMAQAGLTETAQTRVMVRALLEAKTPEQIAQAAARIQSAFPKATPELIDEALQTANGIRTGAIERTSAVGAGAAELSDKEIDYWSRTFSQGAFKKPPKDTADFTTMTDARISRKDYLTDIPGGTDALTTIISDPTIGRLVDRGASLKRIEKALRAGHVEGSGILPPTYHTRKQKDRIANLTGERAMLSGRIAERPAASRVSDATQKYRNQSLATLSKTYDDLQAAIDSKIDELQGRGLSWEDANSHPATTALYNERNAAFAEEYRRNFDAIDKGLAGGGIDDPAIRARIRNDVFGFGTNADFASLAYEQAQELAKNPAKATKNVAKILAETWASKNHFDLEGVMGPTSGYSPLGQQTLQKDFAESARRAMDGVASELETLATHRDVPPISGAKGFTPGLEWQEIPKGTPIPPGLDIRMNLETGANEARFIPGSQAAKDAAKEAKDAAKEAKDATRLAAIQTELDAIVPKNRVKKIAKLIASLNPEARKIGGIADDPVFAAKTLTENSRNAVSNVDFLSSVLRDKPENLVPPPTAIGSKSARPARIEGSKPLEYVLKKLGIQGGDEAQGFYQKLLGDMGQAATPEAIKAMPKMRVKDDVADALVKVRDSVRAPDPVGKLLGGYDTVLNRTKGWWTAMNPAFWGRNLGGGALENTLRGMFGGGRYGDVLSMAQGGARDFSKIPLVAKEAERLGIDAATMTPEQSTDIVRELVKRYGLMDMEPGLQAESKTAALQAGRVAPKEFKEVYEGTVGKVGEQGSNFSFKDWGKKYAGNLGDTGTTWNPLSENFAPLAAGREMSSLTEAENRIPAWLKLLEQGYDPMVAKKMVESAQVAYGGASPLDQVMKRIFPFWTYSSRKGVDIAKELVQNPGGRTAQAIRAAKDMKEDDPFLPEYIQKGTAIPMPEKIFGFDNPLAGKPGEKRFIPTLGTMWEDPMQLVGNPKDIIFELLGRTTPAIKAPIEIATGKSLFQQGAQGGRNLADMDPLSGRIWANLTDQTDAQPIAGDFMETVLANSPIARQLTQVRQATDPRKDWLAKLLNFGTGVKVSDVTPAAEQAIEREAVQAAMKKIGAQSFDVVNIPKDKLARMSPQAQEEYLKLKAVLNKLAKEAKQRAEAKKKAKAGA